MVNEMKEKIAEVLVDQKSISYPDRQQLIHLLKSLGELTIQNVRSIDDEPRKGWGEK